MTGCNTMKIHLDLDCYFVSAERTRYPFLKGKNVVVVKSSDKNIFSNNKKKSVMIEDTGAFNSILEFKSNYVSDHILNAWRNEFIDQATGNIHGIVITKSYEAKKYGIQTGTPLKEALTLCPDLYIIPSDHLFYQQISKKLKEYLELKVPVLEQYSIDEFFGDLDGYIKDEDTYDFIKELRDDIMDKFDLPITIGASGSKWTAKLITDRVKPYGVFALPKQYIKLYVQNIPIEEFPGIGKAIYKKLSNFKITTLGEVIERPKIFNSYGKTGRDLYKRILGIDNEKVIPSHNRKGIGISRNFRAIDNRDEIYRRTTILARYLAYTISKLQLNPTTFYFKIKYNYSIRSKESITIHRLFNEKFLIDLSKSMIKKLDIHPSHKVHYIAIHASNFISATNLKTFNLLEYHNDTKFHCLGIQINKIRDKYGIDSIKYASEYTQEGVY
jgi:DNA polymerase-4